MNWLSWIIGLGLLVILAVQAVGLHRATVCRQEAWLKSTELSTKALLSETPSVEKAFHTSCRLSFIRRQSLITWQSWGESRWKIFQMQLKGKL